jgi:hypothetical protein
MAKVIWKGNGIGIVISSKGIRIIPPCDPELLATLQAIAGVQGAHRSLPADLQQEATAFSARLGGIAVAAAQKAAGERLDAEGGMVFYDADDGFSCGTNGRPPIPLPHPRRIAFATPVLAG